MSRVPDSDLDEQACGEREYTTRATHSETWNRNKNDAGIMLQGSMRAGGNINITHQAHQATEDICEQFLKKVGKYAKS